MVGPLIDRTVSDLGLHGIRGVEISTIFNELGDQMQRSMARMGAEELNLGVKKSRKSSPITIARMSIALWYAKHGKKISDGVQVYGMRPPPAALADHLMAKVIDIVAQNELLE